MMEFTGKKQKIVVERRIISDQSGRPIEMVIFNDRTYILRDPIKKFRLY